MDSAYIFKSYMAIMLPWIPLLLLVMLAKSPWFKGVFGEWLVKLSAWLFLNKAEYRAIHNVTLATADGSTQIDHIFVSRYGVFVVETKNFSGWIFGGEQQPIWTQKLYRNSYPFQNPLRQNYKHIKALEALLNLPMDKFHSVIVFAGGSEFKTPMPPQVTDASGYIRYIRSKQKLLLSAQDVETIVQAIQSGRLAPTAATARAHVRHLQAKHAAPPPAKTVNTPVCDRCGQPMVLRTAKNGLNAGRQFWGCSQYPKCRATQNISPD